MFQIILNYYMKTLLECLMYSNIKSGCFTMMSHLSGEFQEAYSRARAVQKSLTIASVTQEAKIKKIEWPKGKRRNKRPSERLQKNAGRLSI